MLQRRDFLKQVGCGVGGAVAASAVVARQQPIAANAGEPAAGKLTRPVPNAVFQRQAFDPPHAHEHEPGGAKLGFADVAFAGEFPEAPGAVWQFRVVALSDAFGKGTDWTRFEPQINGPKLSATVRIAAGGWYRLEIRATKADKTVASAAVEPVGVGEVLVIAGQSYADGANDEFLKVEDPHGRVVAYDRVKGTWRVAHDPQPNIVEGGTIWPPLGNLLLPVARAPVGFVNVAVGGTASRQWLPGEQLFQNLASAGTAIGRFRAVLWQQGESDVIENVTTEKYVVHLTSIREALAKEWKSSPPWLLAKSTLHPTVYNRPEEEGRIRAAIDQLTKLPGFRSGPDTDILGGENRGGIGTRRHFTGIGQRRAALLWFAAVWQEINRTAE
jgi:hypothetical protein